MQLFSECPLANHVDKELFAPPSHFEERAPKSTGKIARPAPDLINVQPDERRSWSSCVLRRGEILQGDPSTSQVYYHGLQRILLPRASSSYYKILFTAVPQSLNKPRRYFLCARQRERASKLLFHSLSSRDFEVVRTRCTAINCTECIVNKTNY